MAIKRGPGGPCMALLTTQIIYQTSLNAILFDQGISSFEYWGMAFGIVASILITLGDSIYAKLCGKDKKQEEKDYQTAELRTNESDDQ